MSSHYGSPRQSYGSCIYMLAESISRGRGATTIVRVKCEKVMTAMIEFDLLVLGKRFTRQISQMRGRSAVLNTPSSADMQAVLQN